MLDRSSTVTLRLKLSKNGRHTCLKGHTCPVLVSEPGFEPGLRDSESRVLPIGRFRNCRRSGGSRTRAARSKSPACRLNTSDREVGPEGVKPSPRRVKAGHASLHLDPVLLSLRSTFSFELHGHLAHSCWNLRAHLTRRARSRPAHTSPVARRAASNAPVALSAPALVTHFSFAHLSP